MGSKADLYRDTALSLVGEEYEWGEEPLYDQNPDDKPNDGDCSGTCWALWKAAGVELPRLTAEMYRRRGIPISGPSKVGADYWCLLRADGTAHHIGAFIGKGETFEAKGEAYGMLKSTVAAVNKRGAKWYRMPGVDLGELTGATPVPTTMPKPPVPWSGSVVRNTSAARSHYDGRVYRWQARMRSRGWRIGVDGYYGPESERVCKAFQTEKRREGYRCLGRVMDVDGVLGPQTYLAAWSAPLT